MLFKKKKLKRKNKKIYRNYKLDLDDYSLIEFYNLVVSQVDYLKALIQDENTSVLELADLIRRRNLFMRLSLDLGFSKYEEELNNLLPVDEEINNIIEEYNFRNSSNNTIEQTKNIEKNQEVLEHACLWFKNFWR